MARTAQAVASARGSDKGSSRYSLIRRARSRSGFVHLLDEPLRDRTPLRGELHERRPEIGAQLPARVPDEPDDADLGERLAIVIEQRRGEDLTGPASRRPSRTTTATAACREARSRRTPPASTTPRTPIGSAAPIRFSARPRARQAPRATADVPGAMDPASSRRARHSRRSVATSSGGVLTLAASRDDVRSRPSSI